MSTQSRSSSSSLTSVALDHVPPDVFGHFVVDSQLFPFGVEFRRFPVSSDVSVESGRHVRGDQVVSGIDVQ